MQVSTLPTSHPRLTALAAGIFYAIAMTLAFPPFDIWPLAFVGLVPIFFLAGITHARPVATAFFVAIGVLPFWMYEQFWISRITSAGYPPMCFLLCVFAFAQTYFLIKLKRRRNLVNLAVPAAVIWCGFNVARGELAFDGYPWYFEGHPLVTWPPMASMGFVFGAYGVTLLVLLCNGFIADSLRLRNWRHCGAAILTAGILPAASLFDRGPTASTPSLRVAAVQTNVPQEIKAGGSVEDQIQEWKTLETLTIRASEQHPAIIVWPETMKPGLSLDTQSVAAERRAGLFFRYQDSHGVEQKMMSTQFADRLVEMQKELKIPMIVGEEAFKGLRFPGTPSGGVTIAYDARFNSAFVVENGLVREERYDKLHLTPFGEYMPYIRAWPWLQNQLLAVGAQGMSFDLGEGSRPVQLKINVTETIGQSQSVRQCVIATPICFEIADAPTVRSVAERADIIITLTNDGWFGESDRTRQQHAQLARWRAIECGIPVVRSANTGLSCAIDSRGRFILPTQGDSSPKVRDAGILVVDVPMEQRRSPYMQGGWASSWVILAGMLGFLVWTLFGKTQRSASPSIPGPSV